jgi:molybdate transport system regulatory protein
VVATGRDERPADFESFRLCGSVWLSGEGGRPFGRERMELLAQIGSCGSITAAAKAVNVSYKTAWDAIESLNSLAGEPLVQRLAGGRGGGGTRLTPRGERLVRNFRHVEEEHRKFIESLRLGAHGTLDDYFLMRRISMKTSARNQYFGEVTRVKSGAVNDEIEMEIAGGQKLVAIVTHESTVGLGLREGAEAYALIKASSVILVAEGEDARFSARNRFAGEVARVQPGAVNTEVTIALAGGASVVAIVTNESCLALGITTGKKASALFKASSVILGVPA